uniref:N-acyl-aliphatic-L-amino acid amidohydrolase n=1 Tax=Ciona savignyi TaxID=51511 RepID=H2ZKV2_CIOSA
KEPTRTMEAVGVTKFREYLRIKTVHPNPDYEKALEFLEAYGKELGLEVKLVQKYEKKYGVILMKWPGKNPKLSSILLNSHTDVVPVYEEHWKHDAFAAVKEANGDIYGRGTQDMKCVGIQYLEAIRELKSQGVQLKRDVYVSFVPDEEIGGIKGMLAFMETEDFKTINLGLALDEGLANPMNKYSVFFGERSPLWIRIKCTGDPGHGSRFIENNAGEKIRRVINFLLDFREKEKSKLKNAESCIMLGDVTTVNLTKLEGGLAYNIVPAELVATFDLRIALTVDLKEFEEKLKGWCKAAGEGVTYEFIQSRHEHCPTSKTDDSNPWWKAFTGAISKFTEISVEVFPAATDSRFLRQAGYEAIGFSPMRNTPTLLHDHNEFLNEKVFLEGIQVYCSVIPALANL